MKSKHIFDRPLLFPLMERLREPRRFIQVLGGPRQVGKTTLARRAAESFHGPVHFVSADSPAPRGAAWLEQQWETASAQKPGGGLLILDEIQNVEGWSEVVKARWDADTAARRGLKVLLLGSSPILVQRGLTERLGGRFESLRVPHWGYAEMHEAFGWSLDQFLYFGGYPGAASLVNDERRWRSYILDAIVETTISRDLLLMTRIDKPALLRRLFQLGCEYSGQILSFQKMVGQLQDAGNTTTLAHYLDLLSGAGLLTGLSKFSGQKVRQRASSPKLLALNSALVSALGETDFSLTRADGALWGRLIESAVGAHLLQSGAAVGMDVLYWREGDGEVDFVIRRGRRLSAIEVKSGRTRSGLPGLERFRALWKPSRSLLVGPGGIPLDQFLSAPAEAWL